MFINEPAAGFWTDAELNNCIDIADRKLNAALVTLNSDYFTKSVTFSTVADTKSYALPTDLVAIRRLEHYSTTDNSEVTQIPQGDFPEIERKGYYPYADTGKPIRYIVVGTNFYLLPVSDAAYTMRLYYEYSPSALSGDSSTPSSPSDFHDMIAYWASALALPKNGEDNSEMKRQWDDRQKDLIARMGARKGSEAMTVVGFMENY